MFHWTIIRDRICPLIFVNKESISPKKRNDGLKQQLSFERLDKMHRVKKLLLLKSKQVYIFLIKKLNKNFVLNLVVLVPTQIVFQVFLNFSWKQKYSSMRRIVSVIMDMNYYNNFKVFVSLTYKQLIVHSGLISLNKASTIKC